MNKATRILFGALTASLLVFAFLAYGPVHGLFADAHATNVWHGTWYNTPRSLAETEQLASDIVVAEVAAVDKGPDIVVKAESEPSGQDVIPTQRITLKVQGAMKGAASEVVVFHTGDGVKYVAGDPSYAVGERYVLFLTPKTDAKGMHLVVSPEGRYRIGKGEALETFSDMPFAMEYNGKSLASLTSNVKALTSSK